MERINVGRLILGGIVAGIVADVLGYLVDGVLLAPQWASAMSALGRTGEFSASQMVGFNIIGLATGIFMMWMYAVIRPHYGPGPKTAILAGVAVWVIATLLPNVAFMGVMGFFPMNLTILTTAAGIVELAIASLAGAALYKSGATETLQSAAARA